MTAVIERVQLKNFKSGNQTVVLTMKQEEDGSEMIYLIPRDVFMEFVSKRLENKEETN